MIGRCVAALTALVCVSASTPSEEVLASPFTASFVTVPRIDCQTVRGSGVRISDNLVITAAHVTNRNEACSAFGVSMKQVRVEPDRDVSFIEGDMGPGFRAIYSCDGIQPGRRYLAMGYAFGGAPNVEPMIGIGDKRVMGQVLIKGRNYHGMSGGGIFDMDGVLVAIINALANDVNYTFVTPLSETYLCKGAV